MIRLSRGAMKDAIPDLSACRGAPVRRVAARAPQGGAHGAQPVELPARGRHEARRRSCARACRRSARYPRPRVARRTTSSSTSSARASSGASAATPASCRSSSAWGRACCCSPTRRRRSRATRCCENLKRVDLSRPTVLTIGSDAYYHIENILKMRKDPSAPVSEEDYALMERVAERHRPLLAAAKKLVKGRLLLLCSTPTQEHRMNVLSHHLNQHLATVCRETGVEFLDWWADLADPGDRPARGQIFGQGLSRRHPLHARDDGTVRQAAPGDRRAHRQACRLPSTTSGRMCSSATSGSARRLASGASPTSRPTMR